VAVPYIIVAVAAYLLGSIPTGFLVAWAQGIDIRKVGSGNIGATNTFRAVGKIAGIFVLIVDALKGFAAAKWLPVLILKISNIASADEIESLSIVAGIFAVLGHNFTCWLKFKGGKGIATTTGVYLVLAPLAIVVAFVVFVLAVLVTRYVSVGSMTASIALPITVWITMPHHLLLGIATAALGAMAIFKHKSNVRRIMAGTENRLGKKSSTMEDAK
jgi:acyl phosphate:glycerol-3-phosphate acyltransferase